MSDNCSNDCSQCSENCSDKKENKSKYVQPHELSHIKKVIGVVSGKGGVGKSLVTSMLAVLSRRKGSNTAILDADITGPSIPKAFGIKDKITGTNDMLFPAKSKTGIEVMSINLLLDKETQPVVWRGPLISSAVEQFWKDVVWDDVDFMYVDMPPGTGDVALTVFQSLPVDGIIIVTSPQDLVSMIVEKAYNMAKMMKIPVLGIVENMSYFECTKCGERHNIFGESHVDEVAKKLDIKNVAKIPIDSKIASGCDKGDIESFEGNWLDDFSNMIDNIVERTDK